MKVIAISGIIGWDFSANDIRIALGEADGDEIEVQVSSPGGLVFDGLEIYNLIKNYKGRKTTRLTGLAASMASYIVLAADRVLAEENAVYMIHNAKGLAFGDYKAMRKTASVLDGFSRILAVAYSRKSGKSENEIRAMMDAETFLFGQEAVDEGFVDEIVRVPGSEADKKSAVAQALIEIERCKKILAEVETRDDVSKAAALLGSMPGVAGKSNTAAKAESNSEEVEVGITLETLKAEHQDVYRQAVALGEERGVKRERERIEALRKWDDPACKQIVEEAMASGKTENDVLPKLMAAMKGAASETPPDVETAAVGNGAGADPDGEGDELSPEEAAARMRKIMRGEVK